MQTQPIPSQTKRNIAGHLLLAPIHPDPILAADNLSITLIERFVTKVEKTNTCWIWRGAHNGSGNLVLLRGKRKGGNISAKRASWLIYNGEAPNGMEILKACPFGLADCVHPNHMRVGTHGQIREIRYSTKEHRELSPEQVNRFEKLCEQAGKSHAQILEEMAFTHKTPDLLIADGFSDTFAERFFRKVKLVGECWIWTAALSSDGYGSLGTGGSNNAIIGAHRASWLIHNGPIPNDKEVCHNCPGGDNPSCVNPKHLWLGSSQENSIDAAVKSKAATGTHWNSRLTVTNIAEIRQLFAAGNSIAGIARRFGASATNISKIVNNQRHVYEMSPGEFLLRCP